MDGARLYVAQDARTRRKHFDENDAAAFARGNSCYFRSKRDVTRGIVAHELAHVRQYREYGCFFALWHYHRAAYLRGYAKNKFERQAQREELRVSKRK